MSIESQFFLSRRSDGVLIPPERGEKWAKKCEEKRGIKKQYEKKTRFDCITLKLVYTSKTHRLRRYRITN